MIGANLLILSNNCWSKPKSYIDIFLSDFNLKIIAAKIFLFISVNNLIFSIKKIFVPYVGLQKSNRGSKMSETGHTRKGTFVAVIVFYIKNNYVREPTITLHT